MEYIYRMSRRMYQEADADARKCKMTIEEYVTATFGIRGKCVKVEVV